LSEAFHTIIASFARNDGALIPDTPSRSRGAMRPSR
jgi:hypothetical protein